MCNLRKICLAIIALIGCRLGEAHACSEPELEDILYCMAESSLYECLDATSCSETDVYSYLGAQATIGEVVYDCCEKPDKKSRSKCLKDLRIAFQMQERAATSLSLRKRVAPTSTSSPKSSSPSSAVGRGRKLKGKPVQIVPKSIIPHVTSTIMDLLEKISSFGVCESPEEEVPDDEFFNDEFIDEN